MNNTTHLIRSINMLSDTLLNITSKLDDTLNTAIEETFQDVADDFRYITRTCVDRFYESFDPDYYDRTFSLYDAVQVFYTKDSVWYETDANYIKKDHRASNDYIFWLAFEMGYHGGSTKIHPSKEEKWGKHPHPGWPYYRTGEGFPRWKEGDDGIAKTTTSIDKSIDLEILKYRNSGMVQKHFNINWNYYLHNLLYSGGTKKTLSYINKRKEI